MVTPTLDRDTLLQAVRDWPLDEQLRLAQMILELAQGQRVAPTQPSDAQTLERPTWDALYGIASNGQEPPTDEQVEQWLDEHRMEKYGR